MKLWIGILCGIGLLAGGCAAPTLTVDSWRESVTEYVREEGNGDPAVLRDVTLPISSQPGFAIMSSSLPKESTDVNGLLLGHRRIGARPWFIYIVGQVEQGEVRDIRLAAVTLQGGGLHWEMSPEDTGALATYQRAWQNGMHRETPSAPAMVFPARDDVFQLIVEGNRITVFHPASGAKWALTVPALAAT